jgi:hypothetical protein
MAMTSAENRSLHSNGSSQYVTGNAREIKQNLYVHSHLMVCVSIDNDKGLENPVRQTNRDITRNAEERLWSRRTRNRERERERDMGALTVASRH